MKEKGDIHTCGNNIVKEDPSELFRQVEVHPVRALWKRQVQNKRSSPAQK